jgi:hypothetical protein
MREKDEKTHEYACDNFFLLHEFHPTTPLLSMNPFPNSTTIGSNPREPPTTPFVAIDE